MTKKKQTETATAESNVVVVGVYWVDEVLDLKAGQTVTADFGAPFMGATPAIGKGSAYHLSYSRSPTELYITAASNVRIDGFFVAR